ncbi:MAG TPA: dienelactone hydrolase family protein [Dehalococcoidia bacterium]|nr:dienelactone hydrolase family protein [Dehalococcoidia bacterium]
MGEMVSFASNGGTAEGYLASPAGTERVPGVIVIQEWWGLNDNIKDIAERFAREGYLALAPDLYHGKVVGEPDEAGKLMMSMKMDQAAKDMAGAYDYLKSHQRCTGKIGSVGFCMGGGLSLYIATLRPIDACVVYYGVLPGVQPDLSNVKGAVLGHYADHDAFASPEKARELEQQLKDLGKDVEFHIYPNTQHGFFNDTRPEQYAPEASKQTWERTLAFYAKHLR